MEDWWKTGGGDKFISYICIHFEPVTVTQTCSFFHCLYRTLHYSTEGHRRKTAGRQEGEILFPAAELTAALAKRVLWERVGREG